MTASTRLTRQGRRRGHRGRRWTLLSVFSFWLAVLALALPLSAHADANTLASYGATASGWAIQPYVLNDEFLNIPATDQSAPYVFVSMDNTPGSEGKAAYFFPGTAANAVFTSQGVPAQVPNGVDARYPGDKTNVSESVGPAADNQGEQVGGAMQSAQAAEGFAQATAGEANYQFVPVTPPAPPGIPGVPSVPTPPALPPSLPTAAPRATPTAPSGGGGSATPTPTTGPSPNPTATPTATAPTPTATPNNCPPIIGCLRGSTGDRGQAPNALSAQVVPAARPRARSANIPPPKLPDTVEQALVTQLRTVQLADPTLLKLGTKSQLAATDPSLPYASGDIASAAVTRATDTGVGVAVGTHAANLQLFQGLITFATVDSTLQAVAPASTSPGSGSIATRITAATIAGIPVTIDEKGVHVADQGASPDQIKQLSDLLNQALANAGVHIALTKTTSKVDAGFWEGAGGGLEVTAELNPGATLPSAASGVPATHVDFTIGAVSASIYAVPGTSTGTGGGDGGGGYGGGGYGGGGGFCFFCGGSGPGVPSGSGPTPNPPASSGGHGPLSLPVNLGGGELLALAFVVQGVATAAVAAAGGMAESAAKAATVVGEEESR